MITCQELAELVTLHLEGALSWREELSFQLHLGICVHCRAYLRQMRGIIKSLHGLAYASGESAALPDPPAEVQAELMSRFRNFHLKKK